MELLSIGEFARLSGLSPRALRLYDEAGLVSPARVDPDSGYRWYGTDQVGPARLVVSLRQLGVPLAQIMTITGAEPPAAADQIAAFWAGAEFEHHGRRALAGYLVEELTGGQPARYDVQVREVPDRQLLCLRRHVTLAELVLIGREFIIHRMREAAVPRVAGAAGNPFVIYHGLVTEDSDGPVEWCRPVPDAETGRVTKLFPDLTVRTEPAHQQAYVHRPSAQSDPETWLVMQSLAAWAVENARPAAGSIRMVLVPDHRPGSAGPACDIAIPMLSVRALLSTPVCGQLGPLLSTDTSAGPPLRSSRKNGAPESYGHGVVSRCGA
jgi:DNA-binding transcriptional MerR regulator